jgi:hypothetical protein
LKTKPGLFFRRLVFYNTFLLLISFIATQFADGRTNLECMLMRREREGRKDGREKDERREEGKQELEKSRSGEKNNLGPRGTA